MGCTLATDMMKGALSLLRRLRDTPPPPPALHGKYFIGNEIILSWYLCLRLAGGPGSVGRPGRGPGHSCHHTRLTIYTRHTLDTLQLRDAKWTVGNDRGDQMTDQQQPHYQFHAQFNLSHELQVNCRHWHWPGQAGQVWDSVQQTG